MHIEILMRGERILVTRGAGFINSNRAEVLEEGSDVIILDDLSTGKPDIDANLKQIKTSAWETVSDLHKTPMMPSILHMNDVF